MIDFHTHIIPNIDDGSKSVEETFNLLNEAQSVGFDKIISTSHYMEGYFEVENKERKVWIDALNEKAKEKNININLFLGNEIYFTDNIVQLLEEGKASTVNNTSYVLFEIPLNSRPMNLDDVIYEMLRYKLVPVLAHPERYSCVHKDPELVYDLIDKGVLMQCNFGSFIGQYGTKSEIIAREMLMKDMVHFLGSDVHKQNTIYPNIPRVLDEIEKLVGKDKLVELTETNPELALNNKKIDIAEPQHLKLSFRDILKMNLTK